jgi:hypothetical protein
MVFGFEVWSVRPAMPPRVWRYCAGCREASAFVCSEKFRVNAQKKTIDVWLIYRCGACDATWNFPVIERSPVNAVRGVQFQAFLENDREAALRIAFDISALRRHVDRVEPSSDVGVVRARCPVHTMRPHANGDVLRIELERPCEIRLDRLLASELSLSRGDLHRRFDMGELVVWSERRPKGDASLRKAIHDGVHVCFVGGGVLSA